MLTITLYIVILLRIHLSHQESVSIRVERLGEETEKGFQLDILVKQKDLMKLNLSKSSRVSSKAPVFFSNGNYSLRKINTEHLNDFRVYQDPGANAAFLKFNDSSIQGTFRYANKEFFISPNKQNRRRKRGVGADYTANTVEFDPLTKVPDRPPKHYIELPDEMKAYLTDRNAEKLSYVVEILLFIDNSIFKNWYDLIRGDEGKMDKVIHSIRYYYSSVVNAMDLRYSSIKEQDFSISIKLAGIIIAADAASSSWTHKYLVPTGDQGMAVDSYKVLDDFPSWLDTNADKLPKFDNALIFTRLPLRAGNFNDGKPRYISGLANIGAVCNHQAISINRENAPFATTGTASHELAHNLGSFHDVVSKNNCKAKDQFIMSPAPGQLTSSTTLNPFKFSPCSIDYMRQYLGALTLIKKNCLLQTSYTPSLDGIPLDKPVGQFLSIDNQCRFLFGSESFYCAGMNLDLKMCTSLLCYDPVSRLCTTRTEYRASNGTTCGNRKWCHKGNCIHNDEAPFASDFCLSGDYKGPDYSCMREISTDPSRCYDDHYQKKCCAICDYIKIKNTNCMYGDQMPSYCITIKASQCYSDDIESKCCSTCSRFRKYSEIGCEYGNRATWCSSADSSLCYRDNTTCCHLCHTNRLPFPDCQYRDKAAWCVNVTKEQCSKVAGDCCVQCNEEYKRKVHEKPLVPMNTPEIPGGQKAPCPLENAWCERVPPFGCYDPNVRKTCDCSCNLMKVSPIKGCTFGDREVWCKMVKKKDCPRVKDPSDCCLSCPLGSIISSASKDIPFVSILILGFYSSIVSMFLSS